MIEVTADSILEFFSTAVENRKQLNPEFWLNAAMRLNICLIDEEKKLQDLRQKVAEMKLKYLDAMDKRNVSEAELRVEVTDEYREMKNQQSKCDRIEEFILLAKKNASTAQGF